MKRLGLAILLLLCAKDFAQNGYLNDAQVWLKFTLQKKINDRFSIRFFNQDRFTNNISEFGRMKADLSVTYKFTKNISVRAGYAFIERRKLEGYYSTRHRGYVALFLKKEFMRWKLNYRNLFQVQYVDPYTSADGTIPYLYDRNKLTLEYEYNKYISFYVAQELFLPLNNPQSLNFDQSRSFVGMLYNLTKDQQLEFFFLYKASLEDNDWFNQKNSYPSQALARDFVYGIGYSISF